MSNKTLPKIKEPVKIRFKKLKNGNKSVYLAHWNSELQKWEYEFLKNLYIIPDSKAANDETLKLAKAVQAQRIVELQNNTHGFTNSGIRSKVNLIAYIETLAESKKAPADNKQTDGTDDSKSSTRGNYMSLAYHIRQYSGNKITFKSVDKKYCEGFLEYLKTATRSDGFGGHSPLNVNTQYLYMKKFGAVLNAAIYDEIITVNPFHQIKRENKPKKHRAEVRFLTVDELHALKKAPINIPLIKQAFLFGCYTGLRFSDVSRLTWGKMQKYSDGNTVINFVQKKGDKREYLPVPQIALNCLPERNAAKDSDTVFKLPTNKYTNDVLKTWACAAGITKKVTFHVARHTYATLLLTLGIPIEHISKNLGHADIQTTQIYAEVVNAARRAAVDKLDALPD